MRRLHRALLHLYPRAFRAAYGDEMRAILSRRLRDAPGRAARFAIWTGVLADVPVSAALVHGDILLRDIRHASRACLRAPAFTITAVLVVGLGIGAATTALAVADHVLFRPLPFAQPDRLVKIWEDHSFRGYSRMELSTAAFRDWSRDSQSFERMAGYTAIQASLVGLGEPQRLEGATAAGGLFEVLGVGAALGRTLVESDESASAPAVVLLSDGLWRSQFGADPSVLGRALLLDGTPHTVVGVMPAGFLFPSRDVRFWTPLRFAPDAFEDRANNYLRVVARLAPGVTLAHARAELGALAEGIARTLPGDAARVGATVITLRDEVPSQPRAMVAALAGASICLLLIACANLANLQLARSLGRGRELAVRVALGAGADRLVRQVATESLLLSGAGGVFGVALAWFSTPLVSRLVPTTLPIVDAAPVDARALAAAACLTAFTGLAFGAWPALRAARQVGPAALSGGVRTGTDRRTALLWSGLVVAEVAATVVLVVSATLLLQALWQVRQVDPGFNPEGVLTLRTSLPMPRYEATPRREAFYRRVVEDIEALPGVTRAAYTSFLPMVMRGGIWPVTVAASAATDPEQHIASFRQITPGFFEAIGTPIREGRGVQDSDTRESVAVAVVSESFARTHWPGANPLGQRFTIALLERTVVGVVDDIRVRGLERESEPQVYVPASQVPDGSVIFYAPQDLVIRAGVPLDTLVPPIRDIIRRVDPAQPISSVQPLTAIVEAEMAPRMVQLRVLGLYVALACVLAAVGIYGLLAYAAAARARDTGVRLALGASPSRILSSAMARGLLLAGTGVLAGLGAAAGVAQALGALLAGMHPWDPLGYAVAAATALAIALVGSVVPAWRAARTDPLIALRSE